MTRLSDKQKLARDVSRVARRWSWMAHQLCLASNDLWRLLKHPALQDENDPMVATIKSLLTKAHAASNESWHAEPSCMLRKLDGWIGGAR